MRDGTPPAFVFWVHASTKARFREAYKNIADRLELPERVDPKADTLRLVSNWLCDESNGQWTMILDNADDIEVFYPKQTKTKQLGSTVTPLVDYLPQSRNGSILITSRSKDAAARLAGGHHNTKDVSTFNKDQALQLWRNKLRDMPSGGEDASELLHTLDYIPLAITQAAAYINWHTPRATISTYLDAFHRSDKSKENLLNQDAGDLRRDRSASNAIVTTLQLTFESVHKERRSAAEMLWLMSFFNPQGIPDFALRSHSQSIYTKTFNVRRLISGLHQTKGKRGSSAQEDLDADISILQDYSLISVTAEKGILKMHPLVQLCTRAWLSSSKKLGEWESKFLVLMTRELASKKLGDWTEYKQLVPHIEAFYQRDPTGKSFDIWIELILDVGVLLWNQGWNEESEKLHRRAVEETEKKLGPKHYSTLISIRRLALVLQSLGKYDEAEEMNRRELQGMKELQGPNHPDTLGSMNNLALVLEDKEKYEEAENLHRQVLKSRKELKHPEVLRSMNNLGLLLRQQGEYEEAERLHRQVVEERKKLLGPNHPQTLGAMNNLALVLHEQGNYEEAEKLHRQILQEREESLGLKHPETLLTIDNLAMELMNRGKYSEAAKLFRQSLEEREKKELDLKHPSTLMTMNNLALVLGHLGEYVEAERLHRQVLKEREKLMGLKNRYTLDSMDNLGVLKRYKGEYNEAEKLHRQALEEREALLGLGHPHTLTSMSNLALALHAQGGYEEADKLYRQSLEGQEKKLGLKHPDTLLTMGRLVSVLRDRGEYEEAERLSQRELQARE